MQTHPSLTPAATQEAPAAPYSITWKASYVQGKLGLIPAFGDGIGKEINKAELSLCHKYTGEIAASHAELLAALEALLAQADLGEVDDETRPIVDQARSAISRATQG